MFDICQCITTDCFFFGCCRLGVCMCLYILFSYHYHYLFIVLTTMARLQKPTCTKMCLPATPGQRLSNKLLEDIAVLLTTDHRSEEMKALMATLLSVHLDTIVLPFWTIRTHYLKATSSFNTATQENDQPETKESFSWVLDAASIPGRYLICFYLPLTSFCFKLWCQLAYLILQSMFESHESHEYRRAAGTPQRFFIISFISFE